MKLQQDIKSAALEVQEGICISSASARAIVPESLYLFLSLLLGKGDCLTTTESIIDENVQCSIILHNRILSVAQDLIYIQSDGRKVTPKHAGLALTLHQRTRSKELVTIFNKAGHCASYEQVLQFYTAMANVSLET